MSETTTRRASPVWRLADERTRNVVSGRDFDAILPATGQPALRKEDGYFVFTDLEPAAVPYEILVDAASYQRRTLAINLPASSPVEVTFPGEDELFVVVTGVNLVNQQVSFQQQSFVPTIETGSVVLGPGGFTSTLSEPIEGSDVDFATLTSVAGLASGSLLRFVRSTNLILAPGPYHAFDADTTLLLVKTVENTAGDPPIEDALIVLDQVNALAVTATVIQGVVLHTVTLAGPSVLLLGPDRAVRTTTNERGDAVFHLPSDTPVTTVRAQISRAGFLAATEIINLTVGGRTARTVRLDRV